MSTWQERFDSHALRASLTELKDRLPDFHPADEVWTAEWMPHLDYLVSRLLNLLDTSDAELLTQANLDAADLIARTIRDQLSALAESADPNGTQAEIEHSADSLAQLISVWPSYEQAKSGLAPKELANLRGDLARTKKMLDDFRAEVDNNANELRSELQSVSDSIQVARDELSAKEQEVFGDLGNRNTELAGTIDNQKARLDQAIADFQSQFSASQEARSSTAEETRSTQQALFDELLRQANEALGKQLDARSTQAQGILDELSKLKSDAERTTSAIGMAGMAGGYKVDADQQKKNADWLRYGAIVGLVLTAVAALLALLTSHTDGQLDYKAFSAKLIVSAAVASISAYAIVQSAHHRERERQDRRLQIELASIDSYLALMPDEKKNEIKAKLAEAWFGTSAQPLPASDAEAGSIATVAQLIQLIKSLENLGR